MRRSLLVFLLLSFCGTATPAAAHNTFSGSSPGKNSTVESSPAEVSVTFGQPVQQGENLVSVIGPDGTSQWQQQRAATVQGDSVRVPPRELGPVGRYTIAYRIISADGHPVSGNSFFTLNKAGHGTPAPEEQAPTNSSTSDGGIPVWVWVVGAVVVFAAAAATALRLARPTGR